MKKNNPEFIPFSQEQKDKLSRYTTKLRELDQQLYEAQKRIHGEKKGCKCNACTMEIVRIEKAIKKVKLNYSRAFGREYNRNMKEV